MCSRIRCEVDERWRNATVRPSPLAAIATSRASTSIHGRPPSATVGLPESTVATLPCHLGW